MRINYFYCGRPISAANFNAEVVTTFEAEKALQEWREDKENFDDFSWGYFRAKKAGEE